MEFQAITWSGQQENTFSGYRLKFIRMKEITDPSFQTAKSLATMENI